MKRHNFIMVFIFSVFFVVVNGEAADIVEVTAQDAIGIASGIAEKEKYNTKTKDIEVIKVKKDIERGPIRLSWLIRYFPMENIGIVLNN